MLRALLAKAWVGSLNAPLLTRTNAVAASVVYPIEFTVLTLPGMNWEWLKMLKAVATNSRLVFSVVLIRFTTVKSQLLVRGVARGLRPPTTRPLAFAKAPRFAWMNRALGLFAT